MTLKVFIVEDSHAMLSALTDLFRLMDGVQVVGTAASEMQATAWAQDAANLWDLATIDLILREGSGFNLIRRFRQDHPGGTVVILSDFITPVIKERCLRLGASAVFHKSQVKEFARYVESLANP